MRPNLLRDDGDFPSRMEFHAAAIAATGVSLVVRPMTDRSREEPEQAISPFSGPRADLGRRAQATDTIIIVAAIIVDRLSAYTCSCRLRSPFS